MVRRECRKFLLDKQKIFSRKFSKQIRVVEKSAGRKFLSRLLKNPSAENFLSRQSKIRRQKNFCRGRRKSAGRKFLSWLLKNLPKKNFCRGRRKICQQKNFYRGRRKSVSRKIFIAAVV
ncbi:MAG: hypothetical protein IKO05_05030 [Selenomonadaceae bacterium]|nr:hypothetical protein [Selenomonadaceae bacterium]